MLGAGGVPPTSRDRLSNVSGGLLANYTGPSLLQDQSVKPSIGLILLLIVPPVLFVTVLATNQYRLRTRGDRGLARFKTAATTARRRLEAATGSGELAAAVTGFVADRLDQPEAGLTRSDIRRLLSDHDAPEALIAEVDAFLATCEQHEFSGTSNRPDDGQSDAARRCITNLQGVRLR